MKHILNLLYDPFEYLGCVIVSTFSDPTIFVIILDALKNLLEEELDKRADEKQVTLKEFLENKKTVSNESSPSLHQTKIQIHI